MEFVNITIGSLHFDHADYDAERRALLACGQAHALGRPF
jgi:hypothetical protein